MGGAAVIAVEGLATLLIDVAAANLAESSLFVLVDAVVAYVEANALNAALLGIETVILGAEVQTAVAMGMFDADEGT